MTAAMDSGECRIYQMMANDYLRRVKRSVLFGINSRQGISRTTRKGVIQTTEAIHIFSLHIKVPLIYL